MCVHSQVCPWAISIGLHLGKDQMKDRPRLPGRAGRSALVGLPVSPAGWSRHRAGVADVTNVTGRR
jgi:hypothetical protein